MTMEGRKEATVNIASELKVACHREKLESFLAGEPIIPATIELDITTDCTRSCTDCPSTRSPGAEHLSDEFMERLFDLLGGRTGGLLLSGGEPTLSPAFSRTIRLAREKGFEEIAVVTNGTGLGDERVVEAMLADLSVVRISLYAWIGEESEEDLYHLLKSIELLRMRIEKEKSLMEIGISALTDSRRATTLVEMSAGVRDAGAHWVYFHPICQGWYSAELRRANQEGVIEAIKECQEMSDSPFGVFYCPERYGPAETDFEEYYSTHFLMVIGADGRNYLGTEVKYQPGYVIADLNSGWDEQFLWHPERLERIRKFHNRNYPAAGGMHRGILYNNLIEKMRRKSVTKEDVYDRLTDFELRFAHIL